MNLVDRGDMVLAQDSIDGEEQTVGVLEYYANSEEQTVMTGALLTLPHIDTFEVALELALFVRDKYPKSEGWSMITEPGSCASRPIWATWIEMAHEQGHELYDSVGDLLDTEIQATHDWPLGQQIMALDWTNKEFTATQQIRAILEGIDTEQVVE